MEKDYLTGLGLAEETAAALLETIEAHTQQRLEAERRAMPRILAATPGHSKDDRLREQFPAMGYSQRLALKRENPELYAQLAEG